MQPVKESLCWSLWGSLTRTRLRRLLLFVLFLTLGLKYFETKVNPDHEELMFFYRGRILSYKYMVKMYLNRYIWNIDLEGVLTEAETTKGLPPGIDMIFVSHYKRMTLRKQIMEQALNELQVPYEFRDNWDRDNILLHKTELGKLMFTGASHLQRGSKFFTREEYSMRTAKERKHLRPKYSENSIDDSWLGKISNCRQHLDIYEEIIKRNLSTALVIEDDSLFIPNGLGHLANYFPQVPKDFDLVFVGTCMGRHAPVSGSEFITEHVHKMTAHRCTSGYIISQKAARKILSDTWSRDKAFQAIGPLLETLMEKSVTPEVYWMEPPLIYELSKAWFTRVTSSMASNLVSYWLGRTTRAELQDEALRSALSSAGGSGGLAGGGFYRPGSPLHHLVRSSNGTLIGSRGHSPPHPWHHSASNASSPAERYHPLPLPLLLAQKQREMPDEP